MLSTVVFASIMAGAVFSLLHAIRVEDRVQEVISKTAAAGAILFYLSDLAVARHRFIHKSFINRALGLPTYYLGQLLLALTIGAR